MTALRAICCPSGMDERSTRPMACCCCSTQLRTRWAMPSPTSRRCAGLAVAAQGARRIACRPRHAAREQPFGCLARCQAVRSRGRGEGDRRARDVDRNRAVRSSCRPKRANRWAATPPRLQSHGHWRLKGLDEPIELFEIGDDQAPFLPPPDGDKAYRVVRQDDLWLPAREIRHSLPAEGDTFVGRAEAAARPVPPHPVGRAPGVRAGRRRHRQDAGGNALRPKLAGRVSRRRLVLRPRTCAQRRRHRKRRRRRASTFRSGSDDPVAQIGNAIAGRGRCLVILDNFEQVARFAAQTLGQWLARADAGPVRGHDARGARSGRRGGSGAAAASAGRRRRAVRAAGRGGEAGLPAERRRSRRRSRRWSHCSMACRWRSSWPRRGSE